MAGPQKESGEFALIVAAVDPAKLAEAADEFSRVFSLDESLAPQILKSAPIIFAQKLTKSEVKAITPKLQGLSAKGIEFRITARLTQRLPKVNWPVRPQFTAAGSGSADGLAFEWDNTAFVCPNCDETFLFRRMGSLKLFEAEAAAEPTPIESSPPTVVEIRTKASAMAHPAASLPKPMLEPVEAPVAASPGEDDISLDLPDSVEEISLEEKPLPELSRPSTPTGRAAPTALKPSVKPAPASSEETSVLEEFSVEPEPVSVRTSSAASGTMEGGEDTYNVFLSKITDGTKRDKAAELIAKIKGCSLSESKELATRLVIPLAKSISKNQAEDILNQFKRLKIFGRMTKAK